MSLRKRLIHLLLAYLAFVVLAALVAIYGTQFNLAASVVKFNKVLDQADQVESLRITAREELINLRDIVAGRREPNADYRASREDFFTRLEQVATYAPETEQTAVWKQILRASRHLKSQTDECLTLVEASRMQEARAKLDTVLNNGLALALNENLGDATVELENARHRAVRGLESSNLEAHVLAILVVVVAIVWLIVGAVRIRAMLIDPITRLRDATQRLRDGHLNYRVELPYDDELGNLGNALNSMAVSLSAARDGLHASEAKYRALFQNLRDAVVICDIQGCVVECHEGDTPVLRLDQVESVGCHILDTWPEWRSAGVDWRTSIEHVIRTGQRFSVTNVTLLRSASGEDEVVADVIVYPVEYDNATYAAIVLRDVTEREQLQLRVRHADKMEATGTLAGGVAHDFNNLLTSAIGTLSLLSSECQDPRQTDLVQTALRGCWQAANLSRRLLDFASGGYRRPQLLRLREVVELVLNSLDESVFKGIRVVTDFREDALAQADKDQLAQIILNLVRNACDAMPEGGQLSISIDATHSGDPQNDGLQKRHARLAVSDSGGGMTPEVKERLFEPFFTTKARANHRGGGLGLAIVYASVKSAGGFVKVDTELGRGTTFQVYIPAGEGVPEPIETPTYVPPSQKGDGTILVVDDEPMIVQMCADALSKWGYGVLCADSISDAVEKFDEAEGKVSLALIDINLPDGSGIILAEDLVTLDPELRIVFATGYADTSIPPDLDRFVSGRLAKPFALDELADTLSAALAPTSAQESTPDA